MSIIYGYRHHEEGDMDRAGVTHQVKCWPQFYRKILAGRKTAELRKDDRGYRVGDFIELHEWCPEVGEYTGRHSIYPITDTTTDFGLQEGYIMLSLGKQCLSYDPALGVAI